MTKYVGRHRASKKKGRHRATHVARRTITTSTFAISGLIYIGSTASAGPYDFAPVSAPTLRLTPDYEIISVPEPPREGDGGRVLEEWLEAGAPGYIPDTGDAKGLVPNPEPAPVTVVQAVCERGPASALGLSPNASVVYEAICALFPEVTAFGGARWGDTGDHGTGNAIDAMIDSVNGDTLANWLVDHADELPVKYIIWEQHIWQNFDGGRQWVMMEDRGSPTQNHYDHVHISVY